MNKIWELYIADSHDTNDKSSPWCDYYDCCTRMIVRASSEEEARQIATDNAGCEMYANGDVSPWLDYNLTTCKVLSPSDEAGLIMSQVHNG